MEVNSINSRIINVQTSASLWKNSYQFRLSQTLRTGKECRRKAILLFLGSPAASNNV